MSQDQTYAPLKIAQDLVNDFTTFWTFGCWIWPPGRRSAKLIPNSKKKVFLGFLPWSANNILWYDPQTPHIKITKHAHFANGMNDLSLENIPSNVHLQRAQHGTKTPGETE